MKKPRVFVCAGKKCTRACAHNALVRTLCTVADVRSVRCQKICHGSVVAATLGETLEWFEYVDSPKACVSLRKAVAAGSRKDLVPRLKRRRLRSLRGQLPR
jgi:hypothetical protein